jgi:hypothetical protein
MENDIRDRLGEPDLDVNERADLINDLGFAAAVRYDIQRETGNL